MASSSDQRSSDQRAQAADETFHPIIEIMRTNLRNGTVVADVIRNDGDSSAAFTVFTGFANFVDLAASACAFQSLSSNRAINAEVVAARVASNEEHYERHGRYCEFGQINLLIMLPDPRLCFFIMDGQHRVSTMQELYRRNGGRRPIRFQFRAKTVSSEAEAAQELFHFQDAFPADERAFFASSLQRAVATHVLDGLKARYAVHELWAVPALSRRRQQQLHRRTGGDPDRPLLNDNLAFWLVTSSRLIEQAEFAVRRVGASGGGGGGGGASAGASASGDGVGLRTPSETCRHPLQGEVELLGDWVLQRLIAMSDLMGGLDRSELGDKVSTTMVTKCKERLGGCFLGFFRAGKLEWDDIRGRLPPPAQPREAPAAAVAAASASLAGGAAAGAVGAAAGPRLATMVPLEQLVEMGFDRDESRAALALHGKDIGSAIAHLSSSQGGGGGAGKSGDTRHGGPECARAAKRPRTGPSDEPG